MAKKSEKKILLVDDETVVLDTYSALLSEKGCAVVTANCGRKALETFILQPFDLVITDLTMSDGDGFALIKEIKKKSPDTPVLVITGYGYESIKEFVTLLGADELIKKSCSNENFIACVKNSLEARI